MDEKRDSRTKRPGVETLPVDRLLDELSLLLERGDAVVLRAPTGSGKTTRVPPAVLQAVPDGQVLVVEPRRLAARAAASRVAEEMAGSIGALVGYRIRFENRSSDSTRLLFVTEGVLLARLRSDPFLEGVAAVVFDEVHERSLDLDLGLSMVQRLRSTVREELRIVVMSATLDPQPLVGFLSPASALTSEGRLYEVEVEYQTRTDDRRLEVRVVDGVVRALERDVAQEETATKETARTETPRKGRGAGFDAPGDVLVFLPGVGEIRRSIKLAEERGLGEIVELLALYGDMAIEQQHALLARRGDHGPRRVIFATNVAESSVTVQGVTVVVDTGLERRLRFDAAAALDRLEMVPISRASADQRKGRAGRERAGACLRLWTSNEETQRRETTPPDVARVDLATAVLQLVAWGEGDVFGFPWFEQPDAARLEVALQLLVSLRAIVEAEDGSRRLFRVTAIGERMAGLGMHPRLARLLLEGANHGLIEEAARVVALLEERDIFERARAARGRQSSPSMVSGPAASPCDLQDRIDALSGIPDPSGRRVVRSRARQVTRSAQALARRLRTELRESNPDPGRNKDADDLRRLILAAFPDRVARRRAQGSARAVMIGGRGVRLSAESAVDADLFVAVEVRMGSGSEAWVELATGIEESWLDTDSISQTVEPEFDPERERVRCLLVRRYGDLVLSSRELAIDGRLDAAARDACSATLMQHAKQNLSRILPLRDRDFVAFLARAQSVAAWRPELGLPDFSDEGLAIWLEQWADSAVSFAELSARPWFEILRGGLGFEALEKIDRFAPSRIELTNGRTLRVKYSRDGEPPVVAARIQEFFGCAETPRVDGGRRPVLLHLLAPNGRPQQVTQDLASFWANTYASVRAELAGRYPKHDWPKKP